MSSLPLRALRSAARVFALVLLAGLGTVALMRWSPGYLTDVREMDSKYAVAGRESVAAATRDASFLALCRRGLHDLLSGELGQSRQYSVPVASLIRERSAPTLKLLAAAIVCGCGTALALALGLSARKSPRGEALIIAPIALLLAVPVGALATLCLVANIGGPLLVLASLIAARDFKPLYRLMQRTWHAPHFLYGRASGLSSWRLVRAHLLPSLREELFALLMTSGVMAMSLIVPVEVIFDVPGLGQLAWSAAMNRDLPVLLAVTLGISAAVGIAGTLADPDRAKRKAAHTVAVPA